MRYALIFVFLLTGCCGLSEHDRALIATGIAVNTGHAQDESLPIQAREIAQDNAKLLAELEAGR